MSSNRDYASKITKKVYAKLSSSKEGNFEVEAGAKEWFMGVALALTTAITGISDAGATTKDLDKYLDNALNKATKQNPELHDDIKVWKSMTYTRSLENGGGGGGDFKVYIGPYVLEGFYHRLGETDHGQFEFEMDIDLRKGEYTKEDLEKYKPLVKEFVMDAKSELWKNKSKVKKEK